MKPENAARHLRTQEKNQNQSIDKILFLIDQCYKEKNGNKVNKNPLHSLEINNNQLRIRTENKSGFLEKFKLIFFKPKPIQSNKDEIVKFVVEKMRKTLLDKSLGLTAIEELLSDRLDSLGIFSQSGQSKNLREEWQTLLGNLEKIHRDNEYLKIRHDASSKVADFDKNKKSGNSEYVEQKNTITSTHLEMNQGSNSSTLTSSDMVDANNAKDSTNVDYLKALNKSLPKGLVVTENFSDIATLEINIPLGVQEKFYPKLASEKLYQPNRNKLSIEDHENSNEDDFFIGLSEQFSKDAGRQTFIFEDETGFTTEYECSYPAHIVKELKEITKNKKSQELISQILNQSHVGDCYAYLLQKNPSESGEMFMYKEQIKGERKIIRPQKNSKSPSSLKSQTTIFHLKKLSNGDFELNMTFLTKIRSVKYEEDIYKKVNRGTNWDGDVNMNNWGMKIETIITMKAADLAEGILTPTIIKPAKIEFRIQGTVSNEPK